MASPAAGLKTLAVITGANSGLGLHLAKALYRSGRFTHLVLACRSTEKGAKGVEEVKQQPHAADVDVQCLQVGRLGGLCSKIPPP